MQRLYCNDNYLQAYPTGYNSSITTSFFFSPQLQLITNITVTPNTAVYKGNTQQFSAAVTTAISVPDDFKTVTWSISAHSSASTAIDANGLLTVGADETATSLTVTATSTYTTASTTKTGSVTVSVLPPAVTSVSVSPTTATVQCGATQQFTETVVAVGGASSTVTWSVTGGGAGTSIDASGLLTVALTETASSLTVTATSIFDPTKSATATVTLTPPPPTVISVAVSPSPVTVQKGTTQQFSATVTAVGGAATTVTWSVSGGSAGTSIDATGLLTVAPTETASTLTVTATSTFDTGKSGTSTVTLTTAAPAVISVAVSPSPATVQKGTTQQFSATVTAVGGAATTVTWSVSGGSAGTSIDATGLLTVAATETASTLTVTATSTFDTGKSGTSTVTLTTAAPAVISVAVSPSPVTVQKGTTQQFSATVTAVGGAATTVTWSVSGGSAGTSIDATGLLTVAPTETASTLTVTATSTFDTGKSGTSTVTLTTAVPAVISVAVSPSPATVQKGTTQQFSATVTAVGGAATTVTWSVSGGSAGTSIDATGLLTVAATETASTLTVTATSTFDTGKSGTSTVTLTTAAPAVISVAVSPSPVTVQKGTTQQFTETVTAVGGAATTVTWSVSGGGAGTSIDASGLLTVAATETASTLTVTATSTTDPSKSGNASVTLTAATAGITYNDNGSTSGTTPTDNNAYILGTTATVLDKGNLAKTGYTFIGWTTTAAAPVTTQTAENALTLILPNETITVNSAITLYAVWAGDTDSNGVPDYKQVTLNYDKGMGATATGFPQSEAVIGNSTITLTDRGVRYTGYVLLGWSEVKLPLQKTPVTSAVASRIILLGASYNVPATATTLYAVWGIDNDRNGKFDYESSLPSSQSNVRSAKTNQSEVFAPNGISLRRIEVPGDLPAWKDDFDKPADNDAVYYPGCTYRQFGYNLNSINPLYRLKEHVLSLYNGFDSKYAYIVNEVSLVVEYGGVLKDESITGGKDQKTLKKIDITTAMIAASPTVIFISGIPTHVIPVEEILDAYPFSIKADGITEDGVGTVKIYFTDPATGNYSAMTDFVDAQGRFMGAGGTSACTWPKPFIDPETGAYSDELTFTLNLYNNPVFADSIIRQYTDPDGYLKDIEVISGTPLKYMMRSIQGKPWIRADLPLTPDEIFVMADAGSICFRQMDENIGVLANMKGYYSSDSYGWDALGTSDGGIAGVWYEGNILDSIYHARYENFNPGAGRFAEEDPLTMFTFMGIIPGPFASIKDHYEQEYQAQYASYISMGTDPQIAAIFAKYNALQIVVDIYETSVYSPDSIVAGFYSPQTAAAGALLGAGPGYGGSGGALSQVVPVAMIEARSGFLFPDDNYYVWVNRQFGEKLMNTGLPTPSRCRETICLQFASYNRPDIQRWIEILPVPEGVKANPVDGVKHYVSGHQDFKFTLTFPTVDNLMVKALGYYSGINAELIGADLGGGKYEYTIRQVTEPWTVTVSTEQASSGTGLEQIDGYRVWSYQNKLYIYAEAPATAGIYSINGMLIKQAKVTAGLTTITLNRGVYIAEINNNRFKVIIK
ncbi:MAG: Ig-like domain-containing protein [Tannerella sp.]|nr:Ig-like domain-containing protein [Tannerella sp.]